MRILFLFVLMLGSAITPVRAQPATVPTAEEVRFADDSLKFTVPAGWRVTTIGEDSRWVGLSNGDDTAVLVLNTTPQTRSITQQPDSARLIGQQIVEQMRQQLAAEKYDVIDAPTVKRDDAFFLRIEDRYRQADGRAASRLHVYRVLGIHFLMVAATSFDEDPKKIADVWRIGEKAILSIKPNPVTRNRGVPTGQKPAIFGKAGITLTPAKGWLEERTDATDGVITTYRQPIGEATVTVRALPLALAGGDVNAAAAARIGKEDLAAVKVDDATAGEIETTAPGGKFLSRSQQKHDRLGPTLRVENRVVAVGNALLSITSVSTELKAPEVSAWADQLADTAEPFVRR
jgi:hypothetical protein